MGYFASRSAPMGAVTPGVVTAVFHNFQPAMVARAIPDAWQFSSPERALTARTAVADAGAAPSLGRRGRHPPTSRTAATAAMDVARRLSGGGRPAVHGHGGARRARGRRISSSGTRARCLREHRFDGHVAALTVHGLDGLESLITALAAGSGMDAATMRRFRGWTEEEWDEGVERLRDRGILDAAGALTAEGRALRADVEEMTDRLAGDVWEAMDAPRASTSSGCCAGSRRSSRPPMASSTRTRSG